MPSETHYIPDDLHSYVEDVRESEGLENNSQAVQQIIEEHRDQNDE